MPPTISLLSLPCLSHPFAFPYCFLHVELPRSNFSQYSPVELVLLLLKMPTTNRVRIVNFGAFLGIWGVWIAVTTDPNDIPKGFLDQLRLCYGTIPIGILAAMIAISFEAAGRDHEWVPALLFIIVVLGVYADLILDNMAAPLANLLYKTFTIMSLGQTHERFVLYIVYCLLWWVFSIPEHFAGN